MMIVAAALSLTLMSCGKKAADANTLKLEGEWLIEEVAGVAAISDVNAPAMSFDGAQLSGQTGCNSFFGDVVLGEADGQVSFSNMGSTKMLCMESDSQEQAILQNLELVSSAVVDGEQIQLLDAAGTVLFVLKKA